MVLFLTEGSHMLESQQQEAYFQYNTPIRATQLYIFRITKNVTQKLQFSKMVHASKSSSSTS